MDIRRREDTFVAVLAGESTLGPRPTSSSPPSLPAQPQDLLRSLQALLDAEHADALEAARTWGSRLVPTIPLAVDE